MKILKIFRRLIPSINITSDDTQKAKLMKLIVDDYSIFTVLIKNLINYHNYAISKIESINDEELKIIFFQEECTHRDIVVEVFSFLSVMICHQTQIIFDNDSIKTMYSIFVETPISSKDSNLFFKWLKEADDKKLIPSDSYHNIFTKMVKSEKLEFTNINIELFNTIWNIFITINRTLNKIINEKVKKKLIFLGRCLLC